MEEYILRIIGDEFDGSDIEHVFYCNYSCKRIFENPGNDFLDLAETAKEDETRGGLNFKKEIRGVKND